MTGKSGEGIGAELWYSRPLVSEQREELGHPVFLLHLRKRETGQTETKGDKARDRK